MSRRTGSGSGVRLPPDYSIMQRRRIEDTRRFYQDVVTSETKQRTVIDWDHSTQSKIDRNAVLRRAETLRAQRHAQVEERRDRLAALLLAEEEQYKSEMASREETPEARRAKMEQRARELKAAREAEREGFVKAQLDRKWRMENDDLRTAESRALTLQIAADRELQLAEKEERRKIEEEEEKFFNAIYEQMRLAAIQRAEDELYARKQLDAEMRYSLDQQSAELSEKKALSQKMREEEAALLKERWEMERQEDERAVERAREKQMQTRRVLNKFTELKRKEKMEQMRKEREEDVKMINQLLDRERMEDERDRLLKEQLREEARMYKQQLMAQMAEEAESEALLDRMREDESEKMWARRQAQWAKEQEARERLMKEVYSERKRQIETKLDQLKKQREENLSERDRIVTEMERITSIEYAVEEQRRQARLQAKEEIVRQMKAREEKRLRETRGVKEEEALTMRMDREKYENKLRQEVARLEISRPSKFQNFSITGRKM